MHPAPLAYNYAVAPASRNIHQELSVDFCHEYVLDLGLTLGFEILRQCLELFLIPDWFCCCHNNSLLVCDALQYSASLGEGAL